MAQSPFEIFLVPTWPRVLGSEFFLKIIIKAHFRLAGVELWNQYISTPFLQERKLKAMFTMYRIVKRSVAESVPDRASVHTRTAAFEAVSAPEQYCSAPLLKVERSV